MIERAYILTLSCIDRPGIVAAMTGELFKLGCNIAESGQYWDRGANRFFVRIAFTRRLPCRSRRCTGRCRA